MKKPFVYSILAVLFFFTVSCNKSDSTITSIVGTWNKNVNGVNFKLIVPDATHFSYTETINNVPYVTSGTYIGSTTEVTLTETSGSSNCLNVPGTYSFSGSTSTLTFTYISDACNNGFATRATIFSGDWTP